MTPLTSHQHAGVAQRLSFLETELQDLEEYRELTQNRYSAERKTRRDVERLAENIVNACVDITKILLAGENRELPSTYREAIEAAGDAGMLDGTVAAPLADFTRLRNVLAHQYLDIRWPVVRDFLDRAPSAVRAFADRVRELLEAGNPPA